MRILVRHPIGREMSRRSTLTQAVRALLVAATVTVSLVPALAQQTAATLLVQAGQVSLLKDGNQVALFVGQGIHANQMILTGAGSYAKFRVSDGTEFEVFENSQVTFREKGAGAIDLLNVWIGRVKVYVQHIFGPNPTSVTSPTAIISVRGTVFDVVVENEDGDTLVSVEEGKVQVRHLLIPGKEPLLLPGESVHVIHNEPLAMQQIDKGGAIQKALAYARKAIVDLVYMHPGGASPLPGGGVPVGGGGGAQGDKGKTGNGAPSPGGGAPTPPSPPPAPPGGGGL